MATIVLPCWVRERKRERVCVCVCMPAHMHVHTCARKGHTLLTPKVHTCPQTRILCLREVPKLKKSLS